MAMDNPIPKDFSKDGIKQPIQDWPSDEVLNVAILTHKKTQVAIHWWESWYIQG